MSLANEDSLTKTILSFGWSRNSLCKRAPLRYMSWITYIQLLVLQILSSRPKMWISVLRVLQLFFRHVSDRANTSVELVRTGRPVHVRYGITSHLKGTQNRPGVGIDRHSWPLYSPKGGESYIARRAIRGKSNILPDPSGFDWLISILH
jgi:hypothetical protein